tara:strand:+ start:223 stop:567 length:345 start_codon:yes stop_codon:yes gene_type:complete
MPNLNETECSCMGIYNPTTYTCDTATPEVACPDGAGGSTWLQTASGWNWNVIGENALTWGYALGLLKPPNAQQDNSLYLMQLEQQRNQMMYLMVGLGVLMLVVVILVLKKNKTK